MDRFCKIWRRLRYVVKRDQFDRDLEEEMRFHLDMKAQEGWEAGIPAEETRHAAYRHFGNPTLLKEVSREIWGWGSLDRLLQDLRYALRGLLRGPAFALTALFAIALGIGATTAVFSVVDRILFRSLPYPEDDRLVSPGIVATPIDPREFLFAGTYFEWREALTPFEAVTSWSGVSGCDFTDEDPVRLSCAQVESTFLATLGIQPVVGRNFKPEEDRPDAPRVVLLSNGLWQSRFGGDPQAVGKTVNLDGKPSRVIGVLPSDFELPTLVRVDLLVPQALQQGKQRMRIVRPIARLKPGITPGQAKAALELLFQQLIRSAHPEFRKEVRQRVQFLRERQVQDARLASWILMGSVVAVLLIACANVASLWLARAASRQRELAVRAALGARRVRLIRQALTESLLLGLLGGAIGCTLAYLLLRFFVAIAPEGILRLQQASLDLRVLLFTLAVSLVSGVLFGLAPAVANPRAWVLTGWRAVGTSHNRFRPFLVTAQVGASLVLLTGAGLLLQSLWNLHNVPLGMRTEGVLTASFVLGEHRYSQPTQQLEFFDELETRLRRHPEVTAVAISDSLPPSGLTRSRPFSALQVVGRPRLAEGTGGTVVWRYVTPGYFSALSIPILSGRGFREADRNPGEHAVVLSESLAKRLFPNEGPIGKLIGSNTVVGVVGNVSNSGLSGQADPEYYLLRKHTPDEVFQNQMPPRGWRRASVIIRSPVDQRAMAEWVRSEIAALDPTLPVTMESMKQVVSRLTQRPRFNAVLLSLFASIAVLLAAIGLYGVLSFLVAQRTQEIGVRMALGATPGEITRMVLSQAARWTIPGALLGLIGASFTTRLLRALLFQVPEGDPLALSAALALLLAVALVAAWIPARRAAKIDPVVALRYE